ncbi:protein containg RHS repeat-associated core domain [Longilinea arvoryzae]|uniref:Protein containg RHS repeat-associated core domain n=1 Tax=Longilinea arvoryzae TaxID=360412 RepID=A0A0K8MXX4_9CHLR|nr:RHS repeat-associated core domain-containing protein [Longilinea arvoryzae]GAP16103.1 protein containg RHS repeat-associated core domain [Longilinea arvoryzae]
MQRIVFIALSIALAFANVFPLGSFANSANISSSLQQVETITPSPTDQLSTETPTPEITPTATDEVTATPTSETTETETPTLEPTLTETATPEETAVIEEEPVDDLQAYFDVKVSPRFLRPGGSINLHYQLGVDPNESGNNYSLRIQAPPYLVVSEGEPFALNADGIIESVNPLDKANGKVHLDVLDEAIGGEAATILVQLFKDDELLSEQELTMVVAQHVSKAQGGEVSGAMGNSAKVIFPPDALPEDADVVVMDLGWEDDSITINSSGKPWHPFKIEAYAKNGEAIKHFDQEITIEYAYDPEEYAGNESVLYLSYFDEDAQTWEPLPGSVDMVNKRIIARSDHLTVLNPNYNNWQAAMLPSMAGWQVSTFTGAATYSVPLTLPAGPGGFQPSLELSYNSQEIDNAGISSQASWVGMGWSLDLPYIQRDNGGTWDNVNDDSFYIHMNGVSGLLIKGSDGYWHTEDISFPRIEVHGTLYNGGAWWEVWLQDGTRYQFGQVDGNNQPTAGYPFCWSDTNGGTIYKLTWRWAVSHIIDPNGKIIRYRYQRDQHYITGYSCYSNSSQQTTEYWLYPKEILYPNNAYRVVFNWGDRRDYYHSWSLYNYSSSRTAYMESRLNNIEIQHNPDSDAAFVDTEPIRRYLFTYSNDYDLGSGNTIIWPGHRWNETALSGYPNTNMTLTLKLFQEQTWGENSQWNGLPPYTFNYGTGVTADGVTYPDGDGLHLHWAENGYGGRVEFTYSPWACNVNDDNGDGATDCSYAWNSSLQNDPWKKMYGNFGGNAGDLGTTVNDYKYWYSWYDKSMAHPGAAYELHMMVERRYGSGTVPLQVFVDNGAGLQRTYLNTTITTNSGWHEFDIKYFLDGNSNTNLAMVDTHCGTGEIGCHLFQYQFRYLPTFYRVTEMKTIDQQSGTTYSSTYRYSGGKMNETLVGQYKNWMRNPPFTEFRGFNQVIETAPDGHKSIYSYWQGEERDTQGNWIGKHLQGRLKELRVTAANEAQVFQRTVYTYEPIYFDNVLIPYTKAGGFWTPIEVEFYWIRLISKEDYTHAGDINNFIGQKTVYDYDVTLQGGQQFGNITKQVEFEWKNSAWQPVRSIRTYYYPNVSSSLYLTGLQAFTQTFTCSTTPCVYDGTTLQGEIMYLYDSSTSYSTPPTQGIVTYQRTRIAQDQYSDVRFTYDAWGNRITSTSYTKPGTFSTPATEGAQTTTFCYGGGQPSGCPYDGHATYLLWTQDAIPSHPHVSNTYDLRTGNLLSQTDMNGQVSAAYYDDFGRLAKVIRPGDSVDSPTFRVEYIYQSPVWTTGSYGFSTRVYQKIDASTSTVLQKYYNGLGQLLQTRVIDASVNGATRDIIVDYAYDNLGRLWKQSMPRDVATGGDMAVQDFGTVVTTSYDAIGRTTTVRQPDNTATNYAYSISGNTLATTITDAKANATVQKTDVFGRLLSVLPAGYPANPGVSYAYDSLDRMTSATYSSWTTTIHYDWAGRKTSMTDPDTGTWLYVYDGASNLTRQTDAKGQRTCLYYDSLNRLIGKHYRGDDNCPSSPNFNVSYTYDFGANNIGYRTGMHDATGITSWNYNERGLMIDQTKQSSEYGYFLTQWTYYSNDAVKSMIYPGGNNGQPGETVNYTYNPQAALESMTSSTEGYVNEIVYDAAGRVGEMAMGNGATPTSSVIEKAYTYYPWTSQGGRLKVSSSALQSLTYTYDADGNITQMIDARSTGSETLDYTYDSLNRLETVTNAYSESIFYDTNGRISDRVMPDGISGSSFAENFSTKNTADWKWTSSATAPYTIENEQVAISQGNSDPDSSGVKRSATITESTTIQVRFKLSQTGTDARFFFGLSPTLPDPGCNPEEHCYMSFSSNDAVRLQSDYGLIFTPQPTRTYTSIYTFYNQAGLKEENGTFYYFQGHTNGVETQTTLLTNVQANTWYNLTINRGSGSVSGPLTITITQENDLTKTGTLTQTVSNIDWHFRHTIRSGTAYIDDYRETCGTLTYLYGSHPHAVTAIYDASQLIRQYSYDQNGNMTERIEGSDTYTFSYDPENHLISASKNGLVLATYTYDGDGNRVIAVENGVTTVYIGDSYEWRSDSSTTTEVKYYSAVGQRIAMRTNGVLTWLLGDHLGSTTITANANGTLASEQKYTAWGQTRSGSVGNDRQYTGQISESQLGLYFYNARFYDPYLSRWIQPDSIIPNVYYPQDWDRFSYVKGNPIKYNDPSGHCVWDGCVLETAAVGGSIVIGPVLVVGTFALLAVGAVVYITNPTVQENVNQAISGFAENIENSVSDATAKLRDLAKTTRPKPLTSDEQEKIDHLNNDLEDFLNEHPDLAEEAKRNADGEKLQYDHLGEAEQFMKGVENDIQHLQQVRRSRDAAGQKAIDEAINTAQDWVNRVNKLLHGDK